MTTTIIPTADVPNLIRNYQKQYQDNPRVVLRELIQNAADAITLSRRSCPDEEHRITIEILPQEVYDTHRFHIAVHDSGQGMTNDDFEKYLTTLGRSLKHEDDIDIIGVFGIGFYSVAMVSRSAVICSRRRDSELIVWRYVVEDYVFVPVASDTHQWLASREFGSQYSHHHPSGAGTSIFLDLDWGKLPQLRDWMKVNELTIELRTYCRLIPHPIFVEEPLKESVEPVNIPVAPWNATGVQRDEALARLWPSLLPHTDPNNYPILTYCFAEERTGAKISGLSYFIDGFSGGVSLYFKHMLIEDVHDLLPAWGFPFTLIIDVQSMENSPFHLSVPPSRNHVRRGSGYFRLAELLEDELVKMVTLSMRDYKTALQARLTSLDNPERRADAVRTLNDGSEIVTALGPVAKHLHGISVDLGDHIADALSGPYNDPSLRDAAVSLLSPLVREVNRDNVVAALRAHAEFAARRFEEERQAQKSTNKAPAWNPRSSRKFATQVGEHLPVRVVLKEYPSGSQPTFNEVFLPLSSLAQISPGLHDTEAGTTRVPLLVKGDPTEYLRDKDEERLVVVATAVEKVFLTCVAFHTKKYELDLVSLQKTVFHDIAKPDDWTDMVSIITRLVMHTEREEAPAGNVGRFETVDVSGYDRTSVPLVIRQVDGQRRLTVNAWNRGMKELNDRLRIALREGSVRVEKLLHLAIHDLYHSVVFDEETGLDHATAHMLAIREEFLVALSEVLAELVDIRSGREV